MMWQKTQLTTTFVGDQLKYKERIVQLTLSISDEQHAYDWNQQVSGYNEYKLVIRTNIKRIVPLSDGWFYYAPSFFRIQRVVQ